jgi:hypothetical protein
MVCAVYSLDGPAQAPGPLPLILIFPGKTGLSEQELDQQEKPFERRKLKVQVPKDWAGHWELPLRRVSTSGENLRRGSGRVAPKHSLKTCPCSNNVSAGRESE